MAGFVKGAYFSDSLGFSQSERMFEGKIMAITGNTVLFIHKKSRSEKIGF